MEDLVAIAKTAKTRGLRGELVADVLTDFAERFNNTKRVIAVKPNGEQIEVELERFWFQRNRVVLKFINYDSIETAETLVNCEMCVPEAEAVELENDAYFDWELENCRVETVDGDIIGTVREVMRTGATEILVVTSATDEQKDFLIPFATTICVEVDAEKKFIRVDLPEGLLEF